MKLTKPTKMMEFGVYPPLEKILNELYLKVPVLSFEASKTAGWLRDSQDVGVIHAVRVFNGVEEVGKIEVEYRQHRGSADRLHVYQITSHRIKKQIGNRDTKETSKYPEALKLAAKVFSLTKTKHERGKDIWEKVRQEVNGVEYSSRRGAERFTEELSVIMAEYFLHLSKGENPPVPTRVQKMVSHPDAEKLLNTYNIVHSVGGKFDLYEGSVVIEERDGSMTEVTYDGKEFHTRKLSSSYDLPEVMQPKLGMLKMLKEKQAAESIGIRFVVNEYNWFFLCNGEIITTDS